MANTVVGFSINIDGINSINDLNKAIKDTQAALNATNDAAERLQLEQKLGKLKAEQLGVKKRQDDINKSFLEASSSLGAYDKLSAKLNSLRKQYKDLEISGQGATKGGKDLLNQIQGLDKQLKDTDASVGQYQRSVGNYGSAFGNVAEKIGGFAPNANLAVGGLQRIGLAFRAALGPIGLIIIAIELVISSIQAFFKSSEEGQDSLARFGAVFKAIFKTIQDTVAVIGGAIIGTVEAIGKGINNVIVAFGGANLTLRKNAEIAVKLANDVDALEARQRKNLVENAKRERDIAEAKDKAAQKDKFNAKDRLAALDKAIELEKEILAENTRIAAEKLRIAKAQNGLGKKIEEQKEQEAQLEAELIRQQTAFFEGTKRLQQARVSAINEISSDEKELQEQQRKAYDEQLAKQKQIAEAKKKFQEDELKLQEAAIQLNKTITEKTNSIITNLIEDEFEKRRKIAEKNAEKEIEDIQRTLAEQKKANVERLNEALKLYDKNSKEIKTLNENIANEEKKAAESAKQFKTTLELQTAKEIEKINKDQSDKLIELKKKEFEAIKTVEQRNYENQRNLLEQAYNQQLVAAGNNKEKLEEINKQYQDDILNLERQRIQDEIDLNTYKLNTLDSLTQEEKDTILSQNIKLNSDLAKLEADRTKNANAEAEKRTQKEKEEGEKRRAQLQKDIDTVKQYTDLAFQTISGLVQAGDEARMKRLEKDAEANAQIQSDLEERLQNATGLERRYLEQQLRLEKENAKQIAKAQEEAERDAAKKAKAIAIIQSIINGALAISKAVASAPPPFNIPAIITASVQAAAQTAIIAAQPLAKGGVVGKGDDIVQFANGGRVTSRGNIKPLSNGDNVLATLKTGEIVLNESQQRRIGYASLKRAQIPNFANGGLVGAPTSLISNANNTIASEQMRVNLMDEMVKATNQRIDRLTVVYTATTDFEVEKGRNDKKTIKANSTF
jgi:hypothetical protein